MTDRIVHLGLSPKAAGYLRVLLETSPQTRDGAPIEACDFADVKDADRDEAWDIFKEVIKDIDEQLPAKRKKAPVKKSTRTQAAKRRKRA